MTDSLHIRNAKIWTGDPAHPWANSITIVNGRVTEMDAGHPPSAYVHTIDALGSVVTPGLIDAHLHLLKGGESLSRLNLSSVRSRSEFESAIQERHAELPPGQWLIANGWSQENWNGQELPTKEWLRSAGNRPTVCYRIDMHIAVVNDAVLRLCDLSHDPPGGKIVRNGQGEPTGLMIEAAAWRLVNPLVPEPDNTQRKEQLRAAQQYVHSLGVTAVNSMEYQHDVQVAFEPLRDELTLRCRITLLDQREAAPFDFSFGRNFRNDDRLAVIGYKAFIDGTLGSRTARMLCDYADDTGNRGMFVELAEQGLLQTWANQLASENLSPSMHAIGDEATRLALNVIDAIGTACYPRVEHAQQVDANDIRRFNGRIASMQPLHKADDCRYVQRRMGADRLAGTFAFRKLLDAGAILAFGSDWPVVSPDPLLGIQTAVTGLLLNGERFGVSQNISVEESLRAYTSGAAHALQMKDAGVLRIGAFGDLVMFREDPFDADWINAPLRIDMTIAGGKVVYDARQMCALGSIA